MLREVHLHGALGRDFGRTFKLAVDTPAEAVRALISQLPGFRERIREGEWRVVRGRERAAAKGEPLDEDGLRLRLGAAKHLHIIPAAKGRGGKGGGIGKVIVGVILVAAAVWTAGASLAWGTAMLGGMTTAGTVALMGASMIIGGVTMLLSPQKKLDAKAQAEQKDSYTLSGPRNSAAQGAPVPLVYGRCRVGSVVAAASIRNEPLGPQGPAEPGQLGMLDFLAANPSEASAGEAGGQ